MNPRPFFLLVLLLCFGAHAEDAPSDRLHAFYYTWYGNPATDGQWSHWNHQISRPQGDGGNYSPPENIGANFYPANGLYSSNSPDDTLTHMKQLKASGAGVIAVTWWGPDTFTDKALAVTFDAAQKAGLKVCFHIEPFAGRNAATTRDALAYLLKRYGQHPALFRDPARGNRPWAYIYDSYLTSPEEWATLLAPDGKATIRGTELDTVVIGLWVHKWHGYTIEASHFDGFYTYFAVDGFVYGSTIRNWPFLSQWAQTHNKVFVPSVGPGYDDTRIRPLNTANQRARENGAYYDRMFEAATSLDPPVISITSFNEWHEGTQIEPAVPKQIDGYKYLDYEERAPDWYLERTRYWRDKWLKP